MKDTEYKIYNRKKSLASIRNTLKELNDRIKHAECPSTVLHILSLANEKIGKTKFHGRACIINCSSASLTETTTIDIDRVPIDIIYRNLEEDLMDPKTFPILVLVDEAGVSEGLVSIVDRLVERNQQFYIVFENEASKRAFMRLGTVPRGHFNIASFAGRSITYILEIADQYFSFVDEVYTDILSDVVTHFELLGEVVGRELKSNVAKQVLNEGDAIGLQIKDASKLKKFEKILKAKIVTAFKGLNHSIGQQQEEFLMPINECSTDLLKEIGEFEGFTEKSLSRQLVVNVPEGYLGSALERCDDQAAVAINDQKKFIEEHIEQLKSEVNDFLHDLNIKAALDTDIPELRVESGVFDTVVKPPNTFEQSYTKKGLYSLFMELRTPIFMLMPLMMIGGLFASLLQGKDVGSIMDISTYNNRTAIIVSGFPEGWNGGFTQKHKELEDRLNKAIRNGVLDADCLETKKDRTKEFIVLDKDQMRERSVIYVQCNYQEIKSKLLNEKSAILVDEKSGRMMIGMRAMFSIFTKLPYPKVVFTLLSVLLFMYVRKKFHSYSSEEKMADAKEKNTLRHAMQVAIQKYQGSVMARWKSLASGYIAKYQESFSRQVELLIQEKSEEHSFDRQHQKSRYSKRMKNFKQREKDLNEIRQAIDKHSRSIQSLIDSI